jgi:hypothetical protein
MCGTREEHLRHVHSLRLIERTLHHDPVTNIVPKETMEQTRLARAVCEGCGVRGSTAISGANGFWRVNPLLRYERSSTLVNGG